MSNLYAFDITGTAKRTTSIGRRLGGGGEGTIYQDGADPAKVIKILARKDVHSREKIEAMLSNPPARQVEKQGGHDVIQIAWPQEIVIDDQGFAGFSMRRVDFDATVSLGSWFDRRSRQGMNLTDDDRVRVYMAHNLAAVTEFVHGAHHAIVDMKPANIRAYRDGGFVCLVDCDGFTVHDGNKTFPSRVWTAEFCAPETFAAGWSVQRWGELQDRFSLAVLILMLINDGRHPADGISDALPADRAGRLALGEEFFRKGGALRAPPASHHAYFSSQTIDYFTRAFCGRPEDRPSAKEWKDHLRKLSKSLVSCPNNPAHWHYGTGCAWCALHGTAAPIQMSAPSPATPPPSRSNFTGQARTTPQPMTSSPMVSNTPFTTPPGIAGLGGSTVGAAIGSGRISTGTPRRPLPRWLVLFFVCVMIVPVWQFVSHQMRSAPVTISKNRSPSDSRNDHTAPRPGAPPALPNDEPVNQAPAPTPDWAIAAVQANVHEHPNYRSSAFVMTRGTQVAVLANDGKFARVVAGDGRSGWILNDYLIPSGAISYLSSTSASDYYRVRSQLAGNTVRSQSQNTVALRKQVLDALSIKSPSLNGLLQQLQQSNHMTFDKDIPAARWYGLESDAAKADKRYVDAMISARAAVSADPSNPDNYVRLCWAAYYARDSTTLSDTAYDLIALSPMETNTWLLVGLALMSGKQKFPIHAANAMTLSLQLSRDPKTTRRVLRDLNANADLDTQVSIGSALAEAGP
jgi:hypothetical protein